MTGIDSESPVLRRKTWLPKWVFIILLAASVLISAGGLGTWWFAQQELSAAAADHAEALAGAQERAADLRARDAAASAAAAAQQQAESDRMFQEAQDAALAEQGFSPAGDGDLYYRFAEPSEYTCGYVDCTYIFVVSVDGCASGVYAEANLLQGNLVVGMTNDISGSLASFQPAAMSFDAYQGADAFEVTDVHCL